MDNGDRIKDRAALLVSGYLSDFQMRPDKGGES